MSTVKQIFNNHQLKGFDFNSLLYNDAQSGKESINAAVSILQNNTDLFRKVKIHAFPETNVVEAIANVNSTSGETTVLHIH